MLRENLKRLSSECEVLCRDAFQLPSLRCSSIGISLIACVDSNKTPGLPSVQSPMSIIQTASNCTFTANDSDRVGGRRLLGDVIRIDQRPTTLAKLLRLNSLRFADRRGASARVSPASLTHCGT